MLVDSLYDSGLDRHSRRSWTTLVSFGLQALAASILLTLPLLSTQSLPTLSFAAHLVVPISAPAGLIVGVLLHPRCLRQTSAHRPYWTWRMMPSDFSQVLAHPRR